MIDRQAAIDEVWSIHGIDDVLCVDEVVNMLESLPFLDTEQCAKNAHWVEKNNGSLHYCSECGFAFMDGQGGEPPYMGIDFNRQNPERWNYYPGWNGWLMNYCPNCGARMGDNNDN